MLGTLAGALDADLCLFGLGGVRNAWVGCISLLKDGADLREATGGLEAADASWPWATPGGVKNIDGGGSFPRRTW